METTIPPPGSLQQSLQCPRLRQRHSSSQKSWKSAKMERSNDLHPLIEESVNKQQNKDRIITFEEDPLSFLAETQQQQQQHSKHEIKLKSTKLFRSDSSITSSSMSGKPRQLSPWSQETRQIRSAFRTKVHPPPQHKQQQTDRQRQSDESNESSLIWRETLIESRLNNLQEKIQNNKEGEVVLQLLTQATKYLTTSANGVADRSIIAEREWMMQYPLIFCRVVDLWEMWKTLLDVKLKEALSRLTNDFTTHAFLQSISTNDSVSDERFELDNFFSEDVPSCGWEFHSGGIGCEPPYTPEEMVQEWQNRVDMIPELLPRFYAQTTLLDSHFQVNQYRRCKEPEKNRNLNRFCNSFRRRLLFLARSTRGIGDPLVASYARSYLAHWCRRFAWTIEMHDFNPREGHHSSEKVDQIRQQQRRDVLLSLNETSVLLISDQLRNYPQLQVPKMLAKLQRLDFPIERYVLVLQEPCLVWMLKAMMDCIGLSSNGDADNMDTASDIATIKQTPESISAEKDKTSFPSVFENILQLFRVYCGSVTVLQVIIKVVDPSLFSRDVLSVLDLIRTSNVVNSSSVPHQRNDLGRSITSAGGQVGAEQNITTDEFMADEGYFVGKQLDTYHSEIAEEEVIDASHIISESSAPSSAMWGYHDDTSETNEKSATCTSSNINGTSINDENTRLGDDVDNGQPFETGSVEYMDAYKTLAKSLQNSLPPLSHLPFIMRELCLRINSCPDLTQFLACSDEWLQLAVICRELHIACLSSSAKVKDCEEAPALLEIIRCIVVKCKNSEDILSSQSRSNERNVTVQSLRSICRTLLLGASSRSTKQLKAVNARNPPLVSLLVRDEVLTLFEILSKVDISVALHECKLALKWLEGCRSMMMQIYEEEAKNLSNSLERITKREMELLCILYRATMTNGCPDACNANGCCRQGGGEERLEQEQMHRTRLGSLVQTFVDDNVTPSFWRGIKGNSLGLPLSDCDSITFLQNQLAEYGRLSRLFLGLTAAQCRLVQLTCTLAMVAYDNNRTRSQSTVLSGSNDGCFVHDCLTFCLHVLGDVSTSLSHDLCVEDFCMALDSLRLCVSVAMHASREDEAYLMMKWAVTLISKYRFPARSVHNKQDSQGEALLVASLVPVLGMLTCAAVAPQEVETDAQMNARRFYLIRGFFNALHHINWSGGVYHPLPVPPELYIRILDAIAAVVHSLLKGTALLADNTTNHSDVCIVDPTLETLTQSSPTTETSSMAKELDELSTAVKKLLWNHFSLCNGEYIPSLAGALDDDSDDMLLRRYILNYQNQIEFLLQVADTDSKSIHRSISTILPPSPNRIRGKTMHDEILRRILE